ncbi:PGPGW domain-containing protein [Parvularcula sp. LCG005]|uniref:PGPGW domain-containing protein n=1 Tax=Parvularcula sp. LCG005 TaxID=3078805 RepID=UPI002941D591|nr:PGPGW domain-containing protein [Parvularcula sp. LCG005]WOI52846.1 PGPGW domain-containing protein [Parvularcula sp. LCG005]
MTAGFLALMHKIFGSLLVVSGLVMFPLPIPVGLIMIAFGLAMLAPYFPPVQAFVRFLRRKFPAFDRAMVRFKHRCPRVVQTTIEKTCPHTHDKDLAA